MKGNEFPLVEFLIVVAILGIIAAIAIPAVLEVDAKKRWPTKRVASYESIYSTWFETTTRYVAEDGTVCSTKGEFIPLHDLVGKLLHCDWKSAEAAK